MKKYLLLLLLGFISFQSRADIEYKLRYNPTTDVFEVLFVSTTSYAAANIGPSQASIVFDPSYSTNNIITTPMSGGAWLAQDKVTGNTGTLLAKKVVAFQTNGAPIVGGVTAGTEYILFTFTFGPAQNCGDQKTSRLLVNTIDPTDPNGANGDFTSYLNIGATDQISTNSNVTFKSCAEASPTPILFLSFVAVKSGNNALLSWDVSNEDALTDHYEVERSINKIDFISIVTLPAKKNGRLNNSYDLTDLNLSGLNSPGIYYRIKQVNADGKVIYSEIRILRVKVNGFDIKLSPNPAKILTVATIDLNQASMITINITDAAGKGIKTIKTQGIKGANIKRIDLSGLATGSYLLKVRSGDQLQTVPLVKAE